MCLKAFASKSQNIKNTIFAVLRQMYSLLFDAYIKQCSSHQINEELQKICFEQLERLVEITGEKYKQINFRGLGMDMLTVILEETKGYFIANQSFIHLFETSYVHNLNSYFRDNITSVPLVVRAVKAATQLILDVETAYVLLQPILEISRTPHSWHRYLALECFCSLFSEQKQVQRMHEMANNMANTRVINIY